MVRHLIRCFSISFLHPKKINLNRVVYGSFLSVVLKLGVLLLSSHLECTADQQFVFTIRYNSASITVDPTKLVIPGTKCKPVIVNDKVAIFKFKVTECGVLSYVS